MAKNKPKFVEFTTNVGTAVFPHLTKPDTKFKAEGEYHTKLALDAADAEPLIEVMEPLLDEFVEKTKADAKPADRKKLEKYTVADLYEEELDDEGNETGRLIFKFKKPASWTDKETKEVKPIRRPSLFDTMNQNVTAEVTDIWGGSKIAIAGHIRPYCMPATKMMGLSLRVDAVQIIELRQGGDKSAEQYGFGKQEGGFAGSGEPAASEPEDEPGSDADEDVDEF